ncbi:MAG: carboxypeptidase regulatory-like domain-containing protein, partial [Anaerolineales bacterium]|nr:carboxypeptidase regulatory-like domain-containing protein [Anaerolineales bacterium]
RGTYLEDAELVEVTIPPALDGSGYTARVDFAALITTGEIVDWTVSEASGLVASGWAGERDDLHVEAGATDEFLNFTGEAVGLWYGGGSFIQSIRNDGRMDIANSEWLTATERLDDDFRSGRTQTLWASWDFEGPYIGYQGASWGENGDGQMWAYFDVYHGRGTTQPISGTATLPFEADVAIQTISPEVAQTWRYNDGSGSWEIYWTPLATELDPQIVGQDFREYGHDATSGTTEIHSFDDLFFAHIGNYHVLSLDTYRMVVYVLDNNLDVFSAFPTTNSLDGNFQHFYEWTNVVQEADLLKLPSAARQPAVLLEVTATPEADGAVTTNSTITYVAELSNVDNEPITNLEMLLATSSGVTFQTVTGGVSSDCPGNSSCTVVVPAIPVAGSAQITVTASTAVDLTNINQITTTIGLQADLPVPLSDNIINHKVDVTPPTVDFLLNPGNAIGLGTQEVNGLATDNESGVTLVEVSLDGSNWQTASGTTLWRITLNAPDQATWPLYVRATNQVGLRSDPQMVTLVRDTSNPTLVVQPFASLIRRSAYTFRGTVDDLLPTDARPSEVAAQFDAAENEWQAATLKLVDTADFYWLFSWAVPNEDGITHTVRFRATDHGGNTTLTEWMPFVVDNVAPQVAITLNPTQTVVGGTAVGGTISDGYGVGDITVYVYPATGPVVQETITPLNGNWTYNPILPAGTYQIIVQGRDIAGNITQLAPVTVELLDVGLANSLAVTATLQGRTEYDVAHTLSFYTSSDTPPALSVNATADVTGTFALSNLPAGTYTVTVKTPGYLSAAGVVTLSVGGTSAINFGQLLGGDTNGDNAVNILDLSILAGAYNTTSGQAGYDARADFNGDGAVNILDLSILAGNYNTVGEEP